MAQNHETRTTTYEEETNEAEQQPRSLGNQALKEAVQETDETLDLIDELLADEDFNEENAQSLVLGFVQKNGQ